MPKGKDKNASFRGVQAKLRFSSQGNRKALLDLMRRFSSATRFAYQRLLEGYSREELKREDGPLCQLFRLNTRYADEAILKAKAVLDSAEELGVDPRKVVFGGRGLFEQLKRKHLSGKRLLQLKREWREKRQGLLYSRGDRSKGGNLNLRLEVEDGALWLRINLGHRAHIRAFVLSSHPQVKALVERALLGEPYNVELTLRNGEVHAHFTWQEASPPIVATKEQGVLALDANAHPYHLALALVSPDGELRHHFTIPLNEVDRAPNRGAKEIVLWRVAHEVVDFALSQGVAIATERLRYLRKSRRGDGSGRRFRSIQHRFAYASLLQKIHALARRRGVEVLEVNPQDTSTIRMLKYAPLRSLSKDTAAAYVMGRRALGFEEELPQSYGRLLEDPTFLSDAQSFYEGLLKDLEKRREGENNPYLRRKLAREIGKTKQALGLLSSLRSSSGSQRGSTEGRNSPGANPWRVLRVGLFLPLLGREVPRDLSPLKPILLGGPWEGGKVRLRSSSWWRAQGANGRFE
ncbi:IS200/IS605 family accessory protein TnpB-related protein [Thermus sp.]|uniref:IS200/IS605 family accessory protein TnpB-related protein n=1 Tax=Thermus sp. TaxID=275 RepID=UPI00351ADA98